MKNGKHEEALATLVNIDPENWGAREVEAFCAAATCDRLLEEVIRESRRMAERFGAYADDAERRGELGLTPPTHSNSIVDITVAAAKFTAAREALLGLITATFGVAVTKTYVKALRA